MDPQKPEDPSGPPGEERQDKPLGRGLEQISHLFLSQRGPEVGAGDPARSRPSQPANPANPPPSDGRTVQLMPVTSITRARLAAMLKDVQGALEQGLCVIDSFIPCYPHGEIDLLAVDWENRLTIIDFETGVEDAFLLRALSHYDWLLHNLPNVRRMHPGRTINWSAEPRVFLLAPRFSSRVATVARHLTQPKMNWVRYHVFDTGSTPGIFFEAFSRE